MRKQHQIELLVGIFMILGVIAFVALALKVSGLTDFSSGPTYTIYANFTDIGDLKVRAPVTVAGVSIGRVTEITLDNKTFRARVTMAIDENQHIPTDSTANIFSASLLGANYISITPGFDETNIKPGGEIENTNPALILQNLIGKFMFSKEDNKK